MPQNSDCQHDERGKIELNLAARAVGDKCVGKPTMLLTLDEDVSDHR